MSKSNLDEYIKRGEAIEALEDDCNAVTWAAAVTKQVIFSHSFATTRNAVNKYINQQNEVHQK